MIGVKPSAAGALMSNKLGMGLAANYNRARCSNSPLFLIFYIIYRRPITFALHIFVIRLFEESFSYV
jgi:hypothetical protein